MNSFLLLKIICSIAVVAGTAGALAGQTQDDQPAVSQTDSNSVSTIANSTPKAKSVNLSGVVTARKKYSFTVNQAGVDYEVSLANGAPVGLRMNKPWFDWENGRVVVDSVTNAIDQSTEPTTTAKTLTSGPAVAKANRRVTFDLPSGKLFLISRFKDFGEVKFFMSSKVKRVNFYLVTPTDPGEHMPTESGQYIAGGLNAKEDKVLLNVGENSIPIRLGFRNATMNGFSIHQLEPEKTRVFLSGIVDSKNKITATSIVFEPIHHSAPNSSEVILTK